MVTGHVDAGTMSTAHVAHGADPTPTEPGVDLSTEALTPLSANQRRILAYCDVPRLLVDIMDELGATSRTYFKRKHLDPLISDGLVTMTNPAHPRARGQRYILTKAGVRLRAFHLHAEQGGEGYG